MSIVKLRDVVADINASLELIADQIESAMDFDLISDDESYEDRFDDLEIEVNAMKDKLAEQIKELRKLID